MIFAGAATIATLALSGVASPGSNQTATASGPPAASGIVGGRVIAVDDDNGNSVNDQGQTSGDIFTQNAQDQSTA